MNSSDSSSKRNFEAIEKPTLPPVSPPNIRQEQEISPGVYFTPCVSTNSAQSTSSTTTDKNDKYIPIETMGLETLKKEEEHVEKVVKKLKESNLEIEEFLKEDNSDKVLQDALMENVDVIERLEKRLKDIERRKVLLSER